MSDEDHPEEGALAEKDSLSDILYAASNEALSWANADTAVRRAQQPWSPWVLFITGSYDINKAPYIEVRLQSLEAGGGKTEMVVGWQDIDRFMGSLVETMEFFDEQALSDALSKSGCKCGGNCKCGKGDV